MRELRLGVKGRHPKLVAGDEESQNCVQRKDKGVFVYSILMARLKHIRG